MDPRQEPQALFDATTPRNIAQTQLAFAGVQVVRWSDSHIWVTLADRSAPPPTIELCLARERFHGLLPCQIAFLIMEMELLPSLARGMDFAAKQGSLQEGAAALDRYMREQDTYERRLLNRFVPFFDAARVRGVSIDGAVTEFTSFETGVLQRPQRRKRGRPPKGAKAMSNPERQRLFRDRERQKREGTGGASV